MVPKKHASKRTTLRTKHKIKKRAAEKHRKERKEARKNPGGSHKSKKDPGIPALFPFKEKLLNQIEESKRKAEEERERQKLARQKEQLKRRQLGNNNGGAGGGIEELAQSAQSRAQEYDELHGDQDSDDSDLENGEIDDGALSGRKDNSRRAYYKEFRKVVDNADVILQVLDARDPMGTRSPQIERMIMNSGTNKRIILVLNKIDLVPREVVEKWLKYLRHSFPTLAFKASTQEQRSNLGHSGSKTTTNSGGGSGEKTSECVGAEALIQLLKNYCRNHKIKTAITVGAIGFPNVGKSSLINSLKRARVCGVGSTPGFTKSVQQIHLDKNIKLLDCPGIVFSLSSSSSTNNRRNKKRDPKEMAEIMLRNCVKVNLLEDPVTPVEVIVERCKPEQLQALYNIPPFQGGVRGFLLEVSKQRGRLKRGGVPDIEGAARIVLTDWNTGKIPFYTLPPHTTTTSVAVANSSTASGNVAATMVVPGTESNQAAEVVSQWAKEFDMDGLMRDLDSKILDETKTKGSFNQKFMVVDSSKPLDKEIEMAIENEDEEAGGSDGGESSGSEYMSAMEEDVPQAVPIVNNPTPIVNISMKSRKHQKDTEKVEPIMTEAEQLVNPQTNKTLKKQLKKNKKVRQRQEAAMLQGHGDDEDMVADEDYDFGEYFQKPGAAVSQAKSVEASADSELDTDEELKLEPNIVYVFLGGIQCLKAYLQSKSGGSHKLTVTSFLKHLESALRFGNPILIQDVEHLDPILNPILNHELCKTSGRVLICLVGNQDIDFSPAFALFLSTRDPSASFTVTRASLQSQCLNQVLQNERPDVEERRRDLIKLQGEYQLRLHALEKELLHALNDSQGNILDDDNVIATLETLKTEAAEITRKVEETDGIMAEVDHVTHLSSIHQFYQFSLDFFKTIFDEVVEANPNLKDVADPGARISILKRDLFRLCFRRAGVSLLHHDHLVLLMQLVIIKLNNDDDVTGSTETINGFESDLDFMLQSSDMGLNTVGSGQNNDSSSPGFTRIEHADISSRLLSEIDQLVDDNCCSKLGYGRAASTKRVLGCCL
ncbi:nuclear GTP-binding protein nug1 [Mycoemilia scoparia]|uniref:Nuclear GTP-binding protein nug1 n=1 Tax=Mycoemilia scoparia TaxID=417184 RepID=A0A9W8DMU0_9FUNG|nr:nuclear GTP-binding protein nug1 [Mycoemilia scoparia]